MRDWFQDREIDEARRAADRAAMDSQSGIRRLQRKVDNLTLVCRALWELLVDKTDLSEAQLQEKLQQVIARSSSEVRNCSTCGKPLQRGKPKCIYCGQAQHYDSVFDFLQ